MSYLLSALAGALAMLFGLVLVARIRRKGTNGANSIVHTKESAVAVVQTAGGNKRVHHSQ